MLVNGQPLPVDGYLDIGLHDTMADMFVNLIGAVVFSIIGYFYVKNRGKGRFAKRFIPFVPDEAEEEIIKLRDNVLAVVTDRSASIKTRVKTLLKSFQLPNEAQELSFFLPLFASLEYMSPKSLPLFSSVTDEKILTDIEYEQILNYFVCRYLANSIDETEIRAYLAFALLSTNFISALAKNMPKTEACRLYSSEIEYNEENVAIIIEKICELIGE